MEELGQRFGDGVNAAWKELADAAQSRFTELFWNESTGCLFDVVSDDSRDASIRPNRVLAVSLHHCMLPLEKATRVVAAVERELLTPYGLRSLALSDHQYQGRYQGDPFSRDSAYHQGTVWPWLMGPFLTAYLKVNGGSANARRQAEQWPNGLRTFMLDEGVGEIPEVFDGDAPHRAGGCLAQAWSVAELLRVIVEELGTAKRKRPADTLGTVA
jgi:glycogen debranching enzyme